MLPDLLAPLPVDQLHIEGLPSALFLLALLLLICLRLFLQMVDHVNVGRGHRELMRMYAEMTLDQARLRASFRRVRAELLTGQWRTTPVGPSLEDPKSLTLPGLVLAVS